MRTREGQGSVREVKGQVGVKVRVRWWWWSHLKKGANVKEAAAERVPQRQPQQGSSRGR